MRALGLAIVFLPAVVLIGWGVLIRVHEALTAPIPINETDSPYPSVEPVVADVSLAMATSRARHEVTMKVYEALRDV
jgi:hypothetical protein